MSRKQQKELYRLKNSQNIETSTTQASTAHNSKSTHRVDRVGKDLSHIIYYKCDKSGHFANKYTELKASFLEK